MPTVSLITANAICSALQLGEILGVTDRRVRQLTRDGVLKCARTKLNGFHYRLGDSVQRFLKYQRHLVSEECAASNSEYEKARTRRMVALARQEELALKAKEGLYLDRDDVGFHMTQMITACKQRLLAIPSRTMHRLLGLSDARQANQIVDDEIRSALTELSEAKWKKSVEFRKAEAAYLESQGFPADVIEEMVNRNGQEPTPAVD